MAESTETRKEQRATARAERARAQAARERTRRRLWALGGAVALAVVVVVAIVIATSGGSSTPKLKAGEKVPGQTTTASLLAGIPQKGIVLGNPKAPVTLVEFADLQCPFCREYTTTVMPSLVRNYVASGKMKMEFRNVAFIGQDSVRAAQMAAAVGQQNKLWNYVDLFYANQQTENTGYVTDPFLTKVGTGVPGLDVAKAMNGRADAAVQSQLQQAQTLWTSNGFTGTPSFLLGKTGGTLKPLSVQSFQLSQFAPKIDALLPAQ